MIITKEKEQIMKIIGDCMNKTLSEGCLINCFQIDFGYSGDDFIRNYHGNIKPYNKQEEDGLYYDKILGHYDITAVLKYIDSRVFCSSNIKMSFSGIGCKYIIIDYRQGDRRKWKTIELLNKPLHLYTEKEDKDLLELLQKLG